jgi:hypothetical protein
MKKSENMPFWLSEMVLAQRIFRNDAEAGKGQHSLISMI